MFPFNISFFNEVIETTEYILLNIYISILFWYLKKSFLYLVKDVVVLDEQ